MTQVDVVAATVEVEVVTCPPGADKTTQGYIETVTVGAGGDWELTGG